MNVTRLVDGNDHVKSDDLRRRRRRPFQIEGEQPLQNFLIAQGVRPAVGVEDGLIEFLVGQIKPGGALILPNAGHKKRGYVCRIRTGISVTGLNSGIPGISLMASA